MSTKDTSWGVKDGRCVDLTPACAKYLEIWKPQPPGTLTACTGIVSLVTVAKA
jgi:hypothetical protein